MKQFILIFGFIDCISFSPLYANQYFTLKFEPESQQTVSLEVTNDNSTSTGDGYLYNNDNNNNARIHINSSQTFIASNAPYEFKGTTEAGRTYITFTLKINNDKNTKATFRLTSGMGTNPVGLNCYPYAKACQDYTISKDRTEITVNSTTMH